MNIKQIELLADLTKYREHCFHTDQLMVVDLIERSMMIIRELIQKVSEKP